MPLYNSSRNSELIEVHHCNFKTQIIKDTTKTNNKLLQQHTQR